MPTKWHNDVGRFRTMIEVLTPSCVRVKPVKQHGDGDPFINSINAITSRSSSAAEAGLLAIAFTATKAAK